MNYRKLYCTNFNRFHHWKQILSRKDKRWNLVTNDKMNPEFQNSPLAITSFTTVRWVSEFQVLQQQAGLDQVWDRQIDQDKTGATLLGHWGWIAQRINMIWARCKVWIPKCLKILKPWEFLENIYVIHSKEDLLCAKLLPLILGV